MPNTEKKGAEAAIEVETKNETVTLKKPKKNKKKEADDETSATPKDEA